jgi:hypothetical protein
MRTLITYPLPTGGRALVLLRLADDDYPFMLLDVPAEGPLNADADCRILDHRLRSAGDAWAAALAHMIRSEELGQPAPAYV